MSEKAILIPFENYLDTLFTARFADERLPARAKFYLAVAGGFPERKLIEYVPRVVKAGCREAIDTIIGRALPGVEVTHEPAPPAALPLCPGFQYFSLETENPYWERVVLHKNLCVRIPMDEIPDLQLKLYAVLPPA